VKDEIKRLIDSNLDTKSRLENLERKVKTIFECLDVVARPLSDDELKNLNYRLEKLKESEK
jgi:tetrahydromethanopterin S-methyltransferase subunit G